MTRYDRARIKQDGHQYGNILAMLLGFILMILWVLMR